MTTSTMHQAAAIARQWHESQQRASRVVNHDAGELLLDFDGETETHEDSAQFGLEALELRYGRDAERLTFYTVSQSGTAAVEWQIRRCPYGNSRLNGWPVLTVVELRRVVWCPKCEAPSESCVCDDEREEWVDVTESLGLRSPWS